MEKNPLFFTSSDDVDAIGAKLGRWRTVDASVIAANWEIDNGGFIWGIGEN